MEVAARIIASLLGVALIVATLLSAMRTLVLPRSAPTILGRLIFVGIRMLFSPFVRSSRPYEARDRLLAYFAPTALLALPGVWVMLVLIGFTPVLWAAGVHPLSEAFLTSGSAVMTLGFVRPEAVLAQIVCFVEAATGLLTIALLISYLPTIYAAFSRRETAVALLATRAGTPPSPRALIVRHQRLDDLDGLEGLWLAWLVWFADIEESHSSIGALVFFRSPSPHRSWVTAAGCVLDTAALRSSTLDLPRDANAELCLRSGYLALREIADFYSLPHNPDPDPGDAISVRREEWDQLVDELESEGVPIKTDRDQAWRDFAGWRVNYDAVLIGLAAITVAPTAPWSSDRAGGYQRPSLTRRVGGGAERPK